MWSLLFYAQTISDRNNLDAVNIKSDKVSLKSFKQDSIGSKTIQFNDGIILTPVLNRVPGVNMQQGALNTNRITIRGIGARSQFSTNRLKLYFDNIPLTNANGVSVLDDVDLNTIGHINIIKGPKSTQYGSNLGGHIILNTFEQPDQSFNVGASGGSFDRLQIHAGSRQKVGRTNMNAYVNHIQSNEFRENMSYDRQNLSFFSKTKFNEKWTLKNMSLATRLKAFIPSSLSEEDFENNPDSAARNWFASAGFESYDKILLASTIEYQMSTDSRWTTSLFFNYRDAYEPRPFDILDEDETGYGLRSVLDLKAYVKDKPVKINTGLELQFDDYKASNFNNLYQNTAERESIEGNLINAFKQHRMRINVFAEAAYNISTKMNVDLGLSLNYAQYQTKDLFEDDQDFSGKLSYSPRLLPNVNWQYSAAQSLDVFANYSMGISVPGIDESLDENGFFNPDLRTSFGHNFEAGLIYKPQKPDLSLQLNTFLMQVEDLIVARRVEEDRFIGINAGSTSHLGLEFITSFRQNVSESFGFRFDGNFTYNNFKFTDFVDSGTSFNGNRIPAIPDYDVFLNVDFFYKNKWSLSINSELIGKMPLDDANSGFSKAYQLFNSQLNVMTKLLKTDSQVSIGVNNIFNINYPSSILPNAVAFGNNPARYFYPGIPRQFYLKILLNIV